METSIVDQIADRLRSSEVRLTRGRRDVLDAITRSPGPVSAVEIHGMVDGAVPLSSIYRTLAVLCEAAVTSPHHGRGGVTRYELAEPLQSHHHHLVCSSCGRIEDIELDASSEDEVHRMVSAVATDHGFVAVDHALEIDGKCRECA